MKIAAIRKLVDSFDLEALKLAEYRLLEGEPLDIEVDGDDEGEKLTHLTGAIWSKEQMAETGLDAATTIRNFAKRVRDSIS